MGHFRVCTADFSVDTNRRLLLHRIGNVAVDIQGRFRADVTYHSRENLDIRSVFKCHRCEGVAQLVARLLWEQDAAGSSPVTSTKIWEGQKPFPYFSPNVTDE